MIIIQVRIYKHVCVEVARVRPSGPSDTRLIKPWIIGDLTQSSVMVIFSHHLPAGIDRTHPWRDIILGSYWGGQASA